MKHKLLLFFLLTFNSAYSQQDTIFRYINASQTEDGVLLSFTIRGGITCTGVKVERSSDGISFKEIYEYSGVCGSTSFDESYSFLDTGAVKNHVNYYRLELGSLGIFSTTLSVLYLDFSGDGVVVAPQPCSGECKIWFKNFSNEEFEIVVYNSEGRQSARDITTGNCFDISAKTLAPGVYLFTIQRDSQTKYSGRLLVM
jgi:Secretion system C-terminal sorting domain